MNTEILPIGFLGRDGTLFCSRVCAASQGELDADPVDEQDFDELCETGRVDGCLACPACGSDYTVVWPERQR